jgi:hypothetical protein
MSLKKLLQQSPSRDRLLITPRYEKYLAMTNNILIQDEKILKFIRDELSTPQRNRRMTFSASSRGACPRAQVFQFTSVNPLPRINSDLHAIFHQGTFMHMKWQCLLLDAGILEAVEIPCQWDAYNLSGTIDGATSAPYGHSLYDEVGYDNIGWELKSINDRGFKYICSNGPKTEHLLQIHAYMKATGWKIWSLVYENKNDQQWKEFIVRYDPEIGEALEAELMYLNDSVDNKTLPPVLKPCKDKKGPFNNCDFRHVCLDTYSWPQRVLKMRSAP